MRRNPRSLGCARLLAGLLSCLALQPVAAQPRDCVSSVEGLAHLAGEPFPLRWEETSMTDGKPLVVSIREKDGSLFMEILKTREGLWAEGSAVICPGPGRLEARISRVRLGPAAHWLLRQSLGQGATFTLSRLAQGQLRIATPGWQGAFSPRRD
jgi:hypothetical protein